MLDFLSNMIHTFSQIVDSNMILVIAPIGNALQKL